MKKQIEIINTKKTENTLNNLRLYDVKIGQRFRFTKNGLIYIKDTEQGMNNRASAVHTEKEIKTKGYGYPKQRHFLKYQSDLVYEILPFTKGGKRNGAGRKPASYQTKTIAFRVRVEWVQEIKDLVGAKIAELNNNLD